MSDVINSFMAIFSIDAANAQAAANQRVSFANAAAGNKVRTARNAAQAAQNSLARWVQSVNNNRALDAGGQALEANSVNFRRASDAGVREDFLTSLQSAEQAGMSAAMAAAAGIDGQVVDMVNSSVALRDSIVQQQTADYRGMQSYDATRRAASIMQQTVGGLDSSLILDSFDTSIDVGQEFAKQSKLPAYLKLAKDAAETFVTMGGSEMFSGGSKPTAGSGISPSDSRPAAFKWNMGTTESYRITGDDFKLGNNQSSGGWWSR